MLGEEQRAKDFQHFQKEEFWSEFFKIYQQETDGPFEWYAEYRELKPFFE